MSEQTVRERLRKRQMLSDLQSGLQPDYLCIEAADLIDTLVEACRGAHDTMHRLTAILPGNDVATDQVAVSMALIRAVLARAKGEPK